MNASCRDFRSHLADVLSGTPRLRELAWHEHLLGCADCRELLEAEEALEALLETLPEPQLPPALARRVLARLSPVRDESAALDALLELNRVGETPPELASDVLAALRPERKLAREERALDRLLERVPAPSVPVGLADRVLRKLEPRRRRARPRLLTRPALRAAGALAAAVLIAVAYGTWFSGIWWPVIQEYHGPPADVEIAAAEEPPVDPPVEPGAEPEWPPDELLASLDLLESWDLLSADDLDLALASLDAVDEVLLDFAAEGI